MSNTITPFQATELVNRNNVNNRLSEANSKFDSIDGKFPVSVANGGTGGTNKSSAVVGLGIGDASEQSIGGANEAAFIDSVKYWFENSANTKYVPHVANAKWISHGNGVVVGVRTVENLSEFLLLFNESFGPKFYVKNTDTSGNWVDYSPTGTVLYENASGTNGTVTLSDSAANYKKMVIHYFDNNGYRDTATIDDPEGKSVNMHTVWHRSSNTTLYLKSTHIYVSGTSITFGGNNGQTTVITNGAAVAIGSNLIYIWKVVGYKY